uniref:Putative secreted protein n=1 Tax=Anopheles darlingi TaxID=43151 RepID=A0A2M4DN01_ANODA
MLRLVVDRVLRFTGFLLFHSAVLCSGSRIRTHTQQVVIRVPATAAIRHPFHPPPRSGSERMWYDRTETNRTPARLRPVPTDYTLCLL